MSSKEVFGIPSVFKQVTKTYNSYPDFDLTGVSYKGYYKKLAGDTYDLRPQQLTQLKYSFVNGTYVFNETFSKGNFNIIAIQIVYDNISLLAGNKQINIYGGMNASIHLHQSYLYTALSTSNTSLHYPLAVPVASNQVFLEWSGIGITSGSCHIYLLGWFDLN